MWPWATAIFSTLVDLRSRLMSVLPVIVTWCSRSQTLKRAVGASGFHSANGISRHASWP
jgi:hypothetical protein